MIVEPTAAVLGLQVPVLRHGGSGLRHQSPGVSARTGWFGPSVGLRAVAPRDRVHPRSGLQEWSGLPSTGVPGSRQTG